MPRTAVLAIDLQNEFVHPDGQLAGSFPAAAGPMLVAIRSLVDTAHAAGVPVIWTRLAFRPGHVDAVWDSMSRSKGTLLDGSWGAEIIEGVGRLPEDIIVVKRRPSAFFDTDLRIVLRGLGIERLLVAGVSTNWAVESTVRDGHSHDLRMVVVREAVGTPFEDLHEASLRSMASVFASVVALSEAVSALADG